MQRKRAIIMGAAGRDFWNFQRVFKDHEEYEVVAFTAAQIPNIIGRKYPPSLAGKLYPQGITIYSEEDLPQLIYRLNADVVVFSYSDVEYSYVMHRCALVNACGADFMLLGTKSTLIKSSKPLISICAVRTGAGKSQTTRRVTEVLQKKGLKVAVIRHPMPYGNLEDEAVERFATYEDLDKYKCTIEEREEYEPHIDKGVIVFAGVDYEAILHEAEKEADVILWDGGNNDLPFYKWDLHIVVADPLRAGDELRYHPSETNLRLADVVVINKIDSATPENIEKVRQNIKENNPDAIIVEAASPISVIDPEPIRGKRVLVVEDGPTLTHGGMTYGAATIAANRFNAAEIIDPEPFAVGTIKKAFKKFPHLKKVLPAMGYGDKQIAELQETINAIDCDLVLSGTPIDLRRVLKVNKPVVRVRYELDEIGHPNLEDVLKDF
jgi:predicted GTPase